MCASALRALRGEPHRVAYGWQESPSAPHYQLWAVIRRWPEGCGGKSKEELPERTRFDRSLTELRFLVRFRLGRWLTLLRYESRRRETAVAHALSADPAPQRVALRRRTRGRGKSGMALSASRTRSCCNHKEARRGKNPSEDRATHSLVNNDTRAHERSSRTA